MTAAGGGRGDDTARCERCICGGMGVRVRWDDHARGCPCRPGIDHDCPTAEEQHGVTRARLREALRNGLFDALNATNPLHYDDAADELADAVLALPEMAALLDAVQRAEALADDFAKHSVEPSTDYELGFIRGLDLAAKRIRAVLEES